VTISLLLVCAESIVTRCGPRCQGMAGPLGGRLGGRAGSAEAGRSLAPTAGGRAPARQAVGIPSMSPSCWPPGQRRVPRWSRPTPPEAPVRTRQFPQHQGRKPWSRPQSPPIPVQAGSAMTGLSRRRSRIRVPSLPLSRSKSGRSAGVTTSNGSFHDIERYVSRARACRARRPDAGFQDL